MERNFSREQLLWEYRDMECSDLKDKVYDLLGLAKDVQEAWSHGADALRPNYDKKIEEVAWQVVEFCIPRVLDGEFARGICACSSNAWWAQQMRLGSARTLYGPDFGIDEEEKNEIRECDQIGMNS
jgi:hypothetical protein